MTNQEGLLIILSGPSGAGKDTILRRLIQKEPNVRLSISATTRSKRAGENHEEHYYFMSESEFEQLVNNDGMLEYANYCGNFYGTPRRPVNDWLSEGFDVILEIEVNGSAQIRKTAPDAVTIFVIPPSFDILKKRLVNRNTEDMNIVNNRLSTAKLEIQAALEYDYIVVNDSIDRCVEDIQSIIKSEKMRAFRRENLIKEGFYND